MTNAFAFRATSPKMLQTIADPAGPDNDAWLARLSKRAAIVIAAWGTMAPLMGGASKSGRCSLFCITLGLPAAESPNIRCTCPPTPSHGSGLR